MNPPLLEMRSVGKRFGEVTVLRGVDLCVGAGEVHAVVGENGAGKSTLMRIAAGVHAPDEGRLLFCGGVFSPRSPADALRAGIAMAHQELSLAGGLTVAENILTGLEPKRGGFIDWKRLYQRVSAMLAEYCPAIDPRAAVSSLGLGYRHVVEILKALAWQPKVIIFDEPTASLEANETELVLETIRRLTAKGVGVVYVSHRMDEVFRISDRITVLRDGERVASWKTGEVSRPEVVRAMVGRELTQLYPSKAENVGEVLLAVQGLCGGEKFRGITFDLRRREILGFSGLIGSGRTELMRSMVRADPLDAGAIVLEGRPQRFHGIGDAIKAGIVYVPEDRKTQGLFLNLSLEDNILCGNFPRCSRRGFLRPHLSRALAGHYVNNIRIVGDTMGREIRSLSGGNQQKALLARWLATSPKVLIVDEPTRGIDIRAKAEIHQLLREYAEAGHGVIVVSSEMQELIGVCDRILVLHEGTLAGEVNGRTATEQQLIHLATGSGRRATL
ncbi:MAG TPA: sugar ABC transporter ATP-binding protein [Candidatus Saccharimonadales bacterium]|nr:sugar ABC transporter ATP-binding protein [Candidatus Saccharimonadales bacterium]